MLTSPVRTASRVDEATGIREVAEFMDPGHTLFGFMHLPESTPTACVIICSPIYAEFVRNYRREVLIGRRLAEQGIAVQRFHYRGHGNSRGSSADATFETMQDDAIAVAERAAATSGIQRLAFCGTRFGAMIAAAAAARFDRAPLVVWDPILDASGYLQDVYRVTRVHALKETSGVADQTGGMIEQLERNGTVHVLGYTIPRALYESARERTLEDELGTTPRSILVLKLGKDPRRDHGLDQVVERWRRSGFHVESLSAGQREPWWFTSGPATKMESLADASDMTVDWLVRTLGPSGESA